MNPISIDLFAGAGGLSIGLHRAGIETHSLVEWNRDACNTLRANMARESIPRIREWRVMETDARDVSYYNLGVVDVVAGGPPCQPFSIGGKHRGMGDTRNMMPEFVRAVREIQPRAFILENVRGLTRASFRAYFSYILLTLTYPSIVIQDGETWREHLERLEDIHTSGASVDLRYNPVFRVLNAADYGVPQTRERLIMVGFRSDVGVEWHFPEPTHSVDRLLYEQWGTGEYWDRHGIHPPEEPLAWARTRLRGRQPRPSSKQPWRTIRDSLTSLPEPTEEESAEVLNHRRIPGARVYKGHTGSPIDFPAKTLKAGDHGVPGGENMMVYPDGGVRYFTVREAARLQGFPDSWELCGSWTESMRQIGNAVPVDLAQVVAHSVGDVLRQNNG